MACREGHLPIVQQLFRCNPNVMTITANDGETPLAVAIANGRQNVASFIEAVLQSRLEHQDSAQPRMQ